MLKNTGLFRSKSKQETSSQETSKQTNSEPSLQDSTDEYQQPSAALKNSEQPDDTSVSESQEEESLKVDVPPENVSSNNDGKLQALKSKMVSASFGEIITVLMRSPHYKHYSLADLEWLVIPPLLTNQFLLVEARPKPAALSEENLANKPANTGSSIPVGLALWAQVSKEVDEKLSQNLDQPIRLRPDEWRSGEILWLIDVVGDEKIKQALLAKLKEEVAKGKCLKLRTLGEKGRVVVGKISGTEGA